MKLRLLVAMCCAVCGELILPERQDEDATEIRLVGARAFAQCPCCRQKVEDHRDRAYRRRAVRWLREGAA